MVVVGLTQPRALTRIPDPIHGVLELTIFDRNVVDSKPFQRLHFILQQSVNYVSYPSNKNTRFPHTLGVAHLAGRMYSAALSNAPKVILEEFIGLSANFLETLVNHLFPTLGGVRPGKKNKVLDELIYAHRATISGQSRFLHSPYEKSVLKDLDNTSWRIDTTGLVGENNSFSVSFVVDTYWQALRLYALIHDIGHLPMSHAFEHGVADVSDYIKDMSESSMDSTISDEIKRAASLFANSLSESKSEYCRINDDSDDPLLILLTKIFDLDRSDIERFYQTKPLHELRSFATLNQMLINAESMTTYMTDVDVKGKVAIDKYNDLICNLAICIIYSRAAVDKQVALKNVHRYSFLYTIRQIIDGAVDADRLDYTLRDCHEAGVPFGRFDLEAIIRNVVLDEREGVEGNRIYLISFDGRAVHGLEQFFEARQQSYKYQVHHRTASRSNTLVEAIVTRLFALSMFGTLAELQSMMQKYLLVGDTRENGTVEVLPINEDSIAFLDDSSFRTMLVETYRKIESWIRECSGDRKFLSVHLDELRHLLEIVLFRDFRHVVTLYRDVSVREALRDLMPGRDLNYISESEKNLKTSYRTVYTVLRRNQNRKNYSVGSASDRHRIIIEKVDRKGYKERELRKPYEDGVWIRLDSRLVAPKKLESSDYFRRNAESISDFSVRLYLVGENAKVSTSMQLAAREVLVEALEFVNELAGH
jgi:HD superfamily phosphohydrolase